MASISYSSPFALLESTYFREPKHRFRQTVWLLIATFSVLAAACGGGSSVMNPPPPPSAKDALYLSTGLAPNSLLTFIFDTGTGTLGSPTTIAGAPAGIDTKVYPGGRFLFVSDLNSGSIFAYSIDRSTGALTVVAGSPFSFPGHSGNGGPIAIDPAGKFLFNSNASGAIVSYTIDSQTGFLTPGTAPAVNDGNQPIYLLVDPTGKFLLVSNHADSSGRNYSVFSINSATGVLTVVSGSPFTIGQNTGPQQIVLNSNESVLYAALSNSQQVNALNFDSTTGALTAFQGAPYPAQSMPTSLALLPSGQFLYAGNNGAGSVSEYSVNATTGALTPGNVVQVGNPTFLQIDSSGQFLIIVGESLHSILVDKIDPTSGAITQGNMTPLPTMAGTRSIALVPLQ
jgi:6-phosphogluconolactonase (cycloisomerase 2 family)